MNYAALVIWGKSPSISPSIDGIENRIVQISIVLVSIAFAFFGSILSRELLPCVNLLIYFLISFFKRCVLRFEPTNSAKGICFYIFARVIRKKIMDNRIVNAVFTSSATYSSACMMAEFGRKGIIVFSDLFFSLA